MVSVVVAMELGLGRSVAVFGVATLSIVVVHLLAIATPCITSVLFFMIIGRRWLLLIVRSFLFDIVLSIVLGRRGSALSNLLPLGPYLFVLNLREATLNCIHKCLLFTTVSQSEGLLDHKITVVVRN